MPDSPSNYLIARFSDDANSLRQRAATLESGKKMPGPDSTTSESMAAACDDVIALIEQNAEHDSATPHALLELLEPILEQRALEHKSNPPVRSVYAGAIIRLRELTQL